MGLIIDIGIASINVYICVLLLTFELPKFNISALILHEKHKAIFSNIPVTERLELIKHFIKVNNQVIPNKRRARIERLTLKSNESLKSMSNLLDKLPKPPNLQMTKYEWRAPGIGKTAKVKLLRNLPVPLERWHYNDPDVIMKEKMFRLMYDTYKYVDLTVQKALLIKDTMEQDENFIAGYLLSLIFDKYEKMLDIARNMNRAFGSWKAIEHVNGYERIYELSVQIIELVALLKKLNIDMTGKRNKTKKCRDDDVMCQMEQEKTMVAQQGTQPGGAQPPGGGGPGGGGPGGTQQGGGSPGAGPPSGMPSLGGLPPGVMPPGRK